MKKSTAIRTLRQYFRGDILKKLTALISSFVVCLSVSTFAAFRYALPSSAEVYTAELELPDEDVIWLEVVEVPATTETTTTTTTETTTTSTTTVTTTTETTVTTTTTETEATSVSDTTKVTSTKKKKTTTETTVTTKKKKKTSKTTAKVDTTPSEETTTEAVVEEKVGKLPITQSEFIMLANLVAHEYGANWVPLKEKAKVVMTVMNRVRSSRFPNSVKKVILQKNQYCWVPDSYYWKRTTQSCKDAVTYYFNHQSEFSTKLYFYYGDGRINHFS